MSVFALADVRAVLGIRDYRGFLASRFLTTLAMQMQGLVVSWQVYQLTKDPLALGLIGLVEAVAFIGCVLWAGHFADRHEKRRIIFTNQGLLLASAIALAALSIHPTPAVLWIYVIVAGTGAAQSFLWPASFAYSETSVPKTIYARAATLNSTAWEVGNIIGPAVGGLVYGWKGPVTAHALVGVLLVLAMVFSARLAPRPPSAQPAASTLNFWSGIRFVRSQPVMLGAMTLDMLAVLFGGVYAILPLFADRLQVGPEGLGWLRAAPSFGAVTVAFWQATRPPPAKIGRTLLTAGAFFGVFTICFAFSDHFWFSLALLTACGMADNFSVVIRASILQALTPDAMRGRVSAVNGIFIGTSNEIGAFESGLAAKIMGTVPSVVFGGAMTLLAVAWVAWKFPDLRRLTRLHAPS